MDHRFLAIIAIICVFFCAYIKKKLGYFKDLQIPYIPATTQLKHMCQIILRRKHMIEVIRDIYNSHPDAKYFGMYDFLVPTIVVKDLELIKSITIKNFNFFSDHKPLVAKSVDRLYGKMLFNLKGEEWHKSRKKLDLAFTPKKLRSMLELTQECMKNCMDYLQSRIDSGTNEVVDTKDAFIRHTNDVLATTSFGERLNSLTDPENKFYVYSRKSSVLDNVFWLKFTLYKSLPRLMELLNVKYASDEAAAFCQHVVRTNMKMRDETGASRPDILQVAMGLREFLSLEDITCQVFSLYFGGLETTSSLMCIMAHEIAIRPDVQRKLQEEIDRALEKTQGQPTFDGMTGLPYLEAVFHETMRMHSQTPIMDRLCVEPFELPPALPGGKPLLIQPGTTIMIPTAGIHRDPKYYEDPDKFDPERYYKRKVSANDVLNLGFGIGPRLCLGARSTLLLVKMFFFHLLSRFQLEPLANTGEQFTYSLKHLLIVPENGYYLKIVPRAKGL